MPTGAKSKLCALRSSVVSLLRIYLSLARVKIFIQNGGRGSFPGGENDRRSLVEEEENDENRLRRVDDVLRAKERNNSSNDD